MFYVKFVSASAKHISWLQSKIQTLSKIKGAIGKADSVYQLSYAKKDSKILIPKMYYNQKLPHLKRKYNKLQKLLAIDSKEQNTSE